ncbi:terminase small subunit [Lactobacillus kefiranofaciens]|uniref:terminase small subunit n=1 Tax=Lactobacillus kefiranofaciens TaxID=267818 RepID=UPI0021C338A0|nr:terminase small subunit [Lactobacillus kefiranofaciens]MCP9330465.1 DNA-binding protein [Lactobacillus kefiranofaciens]
MKISLDDEQVAQIKTLIFSTVQKGIQQTVNTRPYLNRKEIAKYFGVAESTITFWVSLGMPVAVIDGRKLYGKQSITAWLKAHEMPSQKAIEQTKKPLTIGVVKDVQ